MLRISIPPGATAYYQVADTQLYSGYKAGARSTPLARQPTMSDQP